jgi:formylglycine-generating enzyme
MTAMRFFSPLLFLVAAGSLASCSSSEDATHDPEDAGASTQPIVDGGTAACPEGTRGAEMVLVPFPDGTTYCIDKWPTTVGEYRAFLADKDSLSSMPIPPQPCSANGAWVPATEGEFTNCTAELWGPNVDPANTMQCVDWCAATRYCAWAGKRLCAGPHGAGPTQPPDPATGQDPLLAQPAYNEWVNACSAAGTLTYPYGDSYETTRCQGRLADSVANHPECRGPAGTPFNEVVGMTGLVIQWTGLCYDASVVGSCVIGGTSGGEANTAPSQRCDAIRALGRHSGGVGLGIRCCSDSVTD